MAYPNVLYTSNQRKNTSYVSTLCNDLRLAELFPILCAHPELGGACFPADIAARHEVFCALAADETLVAELTVLRDEMEEICRLHRLMTAAHCEEERTVMFFLLHRRLWHWTGEAAKCRMQGTFFDAFVRLFSDLTASEDYAAMKRDLEMLDTATAPLFRYSLKLTGKTRDTGSRVTLSAAVPETFSERLSRCAEQLGIGLSEEKSVCDPDPFQIAGLLSLYPEVLQTLRAFAVRYGDFFDDSVYSYADQLSFYLQAYALTCRLAACGIPAVLPHITQPDADGAAVLSLREAYDISLLTRGVTEIVPNDVTLNEADPFYFVVGANGGGKTTFLRAVGICAYFAMLGVPVPCREATLCELGGVVSHFPADERFAADGRFADEERRVELMLSAVTGRALVLLNETFSTTTDEKASAKTEALAHRIRESGNFGLYVTHQHAAASSDFPSLCAEVVSDDCHSRTFKIHRSSEVTGSFAQDILRKYCLTEDDLLRRFAGDGKGKEV